MSDPSACFAADLRASLAARDRDLDEARKPAEVMCGRQKLTSAGRPGCERMDEGETP